MWSGTKTSWNSSLRIGIIFKILGYFGNKVASCAGLY